MTPNKPDSSRQSQALRLGPACLLGLGSRACFTSNHTVDVGFETPLTPSEILCSF